MADPRKRAVLASLPFAAQVICIIEGHTSADKPDIPNYSSEFNDTARVWVRTKGPF